jgi:hypothetical protein
VELVIRTENSSSRTARAQLRLLQDDDDDGMVGEAVARSLARGEGPNEREGVPGEVEKNRQTDRPGLNECSSSSGGSSSSSSSSTQHSGEEKENNENNV